MLEVLALTPIFFVSIIYLYIVGFEKLDELPDEILNDFMELRDAEIQNIMEVQFVLSYLGNISKHDTDEMTLYELRSWYNLIKKRKAMEAESAK